MKYHLLRDTRKQVDGVPTGRRMSCSITAESKEEAEELFEERWAASGGEAGYRQPTAPATVRAVAPITNASLREKFMSPGALEIKRRTPVFANV